MSSIDEYLNKYGDISFKDKPFCEADNFALCNVSYIPLEKVISDSFDDEPVPFEKACQKMFRYNGYKHVAVGLVLPKGMSIRLMKMSRCKRYSEMKVVACTETFSTSPAVQFGAATYLLPDGTVLVVFRGTDDTLIGWKEDIDIFTHKGIPSHKLAVDYLAKVAEKFDGDIIVCGHSKGGNVAQYGVLYSSEKVRERIKEFYNNDGPGFFDYSFMKMPQYSEMLPKYKHFVPQSSLVGMLLFHDDDYTVVKSKRLTGPLQHDISSWLVEDDKAVSLPELSSLGKLTDLTCHKLFTQINDVQSECFDKIAEVVVNGTGCRGLLDFSKHVPSAIKGAKKAYKAVDEETRKVFKSTFNGALSIIKEAKNEVSSGRFSTVAERISAIGGDYESVKL